MATNERSEMHGHNEAGHDDGRTVGALMVVLGLFFLLSQWFDLDIYGLLILGTGFTAWGVLARKAGPLIPGGILNGIALGSLLMNGQIAQLVGEPAEGGLFLLGFALGWLSIEVFSRLFTTDIQRWVRIPGGVLAVIGAITLAQEPGFQILRLIGLVWPVVLLVAGAALLLGWREKRDMTKG